MMKLTTFLSLETIRCGIELSSKKRVLEFIGQLIATSLNEKTVEHNGQEICPIECFAQLFKREKIGSTGISNGVALPHAKLPDNVVWETPIAVFLQLETAIDYEAADNKAVDLVYAVLFPEQTCATYKEALPEIARCLSDKSLQKQLRSAESAEDIWQILHHADNQASEEA